MDQRHPTVVNRSSDLPVDVGEGINYLATTDRTRGFASEVTTQTQRQLASRSLHQEHHDEGNLTRNCHSVRDPLIPVDTSRGTMADGLPLHH